MDTEKQYAEMVEAQEGFERKIVSPSGEVLCCCDGTLRSILACLKNQPDSSNDLETSIDGMYLLEMAQDCPIKGLEKLAEKAVK